MPSSKILPMFFQTFWTLSFQILTPSLVTLASQVLLPSRDATQLEGLTVYPSDKEALPSTGYNCKESPAHSKSMESTTSFMEPRIKEVVQKSYLQILIPSYWQLKICWNVSWMSRKEKSVRFTYHTNLHINHKQKHDILRCQKNLEISKISEANINFIRSSQLVNHTKVEIFRYWILQQTDTSVYLLCL